MDTYLEVRRLANDGLSITEIGRQQGISRNTVRKYLFLKRPPGYRRSAPPSPTRLDPYKDRIRQRVLECPELNAKRIFQEIKKDGEKDGFTGSLRTVRRFVQTLRADRPIQAVLRFETDPGRQAQVDWAYFGWIDLDGERRRLYAFIMILGFSRAVYIEFTTQTDTATLLRCHLNAFAYLGGIPKEILYDNMKSVVLRRAIKTEDSEWNPLFIDFVHHFGAVPRLCWPYRPQTKGKVENSVKFVRSDFFVGRSFSSFQDINRQAHAWCNEANQRVHRTTGIPPIDRLAQEELPALNSWPVYLIVQSFSRKISRECFVAFLGNRYSVPFQHAGRECLVKVHDDQLTIEVGGKPVAQHVLHRGSGSTIRDRTHFTGLMTAIKHQNLEVFQASLSSFEPPVVDQRPLAVYQQLAEETRR